MKIRKINAMNSYALHAFSRITRSQNYMFLRFLIFRQLGIETGFGLGEKERAFPVDCLQVRVGAEFEQSVLITNSERNF